jgi:hypothetical protein
MAGTDDVSENHRIARLLGGYIIAINTIVKVVVVGASTQDDRNKGYQKTTQ